MQLIRSTLLAMLATICSVTSAQTAVSSTPTESARPLRALPAGVTRGPTVEGITEYRLANGLRIVLFADQSKPTVAVNITYLVGSRHENYGETGMAHLLEHLIFKGSKNFARPFDEFTRRGFQNNGSTWLDRTNYYATFLASDDNLKWAIDWSADAMINSFIAKKDLDSEMTVVRNEYERGENNPTQVVLKRMQSMLYDWHNYGNSTIGARSDIENVRIENLQAFYRMYYQPDNAVLIVAGKIDEGKTLTWIAQAFGKIPKPKRTLPVSWTLEPTHDGERAFTVRRSGEVQLVMFGYRVPSSLSPQSLATGIAAEILGDTPNGRLHQALVASGKATQVFNFNIDAREPGFILFGAIVKKGEPLEPVRQAMIDVIEGSWAKTPTTDAELKRQVQLQRTSYDRALADPQAFGVGLSEYVSLGDWRLFFLQRDQLAKVNAGEVDTAARKYFVRDNRVVGSFIPEDAPVRADIPVAPNAAQLLADYKPSEKGAVAEAFVPSQANIDKRTRVLSFGSLNLALLPKQNRGNTVTVQSQFRWGSAESLTGRTIESDLAASMLGRGTDKMTRQQIADEMTRLQMTGGLTGFQTTRDHLPDALRLLAHVMRAASFPPSEYEQLQRQVETSLQSQLDNPETISRDALAIHFNTYPAGDPRYYIPLRARIDMVAKTPLDAARRFFSDFYGTARGEVAVVGDFDAKQIEPLVNGLFADYQSKAPYARLDREFREVKPARLAIDTPDKENAFIRARIDFPLRDDDADAPALVLANDIFGDGPGFSNRVVERLRQRDGISYSVGTRVALGSRYRVSSWTLSAIMAPQNAAKAEQALREEIERARRDGFTAKELDDAKKGTLQERSTNRSQDSVLAGAWTANMDLGRTFAFSQQFEDRLRAVTLDQLNAAFRKYIDPARMTFVVAGDAKKGAK